MFSNGHAKKDNTDVWIFGGMPSLENTAEDDCLGMLGGGCRKYSLWWMVGIVRSRFTATHSPCEEQPCPGWCPVCLDIPSTTFVTGLKRKILNPKYFAVFMKSLFEKLLCWFSVKKSCTDKMVWAAIKKCQNVTLFEEQITRKSTHRCASLLDYLSWLSWLSWLS